MNASLTLSTAESLEQEFCDSIDKNGPVTIMGVTFDRSTILMEMAPFVYTAELAAFFDAMGFDPDEE